MKLVMPVSDKLDVQIFGVLGDTQVSVDNHMGESLDPNLPSHLR